MTHEKNDLIIVADSRWAEHRIRESLRPLTKKIYYVPNPSARLNHGDWFGREWLFLWHTASMVIEAQTEQDALDALVDSEWGHMIIDEDPDDAEFCARAGNEGKPVNLDDLTAILPCTSSFTLKRYYDDYEAKRIKSPIYTDIMRGRTTRLAYAIIKYRSNLAESFGVEDDDLDSHDVVQLLGSTNHFLLNKEAPQTWLDHADSGRYLTVANLHGFYTLSEMNIALAGLMAIYAMFSVTARDEVAANPTYEDVANDTQIRLLNSPKDDDDE